MRGRRVGHDRSPVKARVINGSDRRSDGRRCVGSQVSGRGKVGLLSLSTR